MSERLRLKPYESETGERLRGGTGYTYEFSGPAWTLYYRDPGDPHWYLYDDHLTALGVLRTRDWLLPLVTEYKVMLDV